MPRSLSILSRSVVTLPPAGIVLAALVLLQPLLLPGSTQAQQTGDPVVEVRDGVRYIHNRSPRWGDHPQVRLEFVRRIGDLETADEHFLLFRPSDVVRDAEGNLYVLDSGNHRIQKYGPDGTWQATLTGQGAGPGEVNSPFSLNLAPDGNLHVCDLGNQRVQVFTTAGDPVRSIRMGLEGGKRFTNFRMRSTGEYLARTAPAMYPNEDVAAVPLLLVFDTECMPTRNVGVGRLEDYGDFATTVFMSVHTFDRDEQDNLYLDYAYQNRIEKYAPEGRLLWQADRPLEFRVEMSPQSIEEVVHVSNGAAVDGRGRLWVLTATRIPTMEELEAQEETSELQSMIEIFDGDGTLLGRLTDQAFAHIPIIPPVATPAMGVIRIFDDRLYLVDMLGRMCVFEYRIVEGG